MLEEEEEEVVARETNSDRPTSGVLLLLFCLSLFFGVCLGGSLEEGLPAGLEI